MNHFDLQASRHSVRRSGGRPFSRGLLSGLLSFLVVALFATGIVLIAYATIATSLPAPGELTNRASSFQSTRILDRAGGLLNETFDPNAGRRIAVPLATISPYLRQATIATEDANFYSHRGVDPIALLRALYYALREGDVVSGGSTIPQQLVKLVFLSPERTIARKLREAILSAEISRRYDKDQILEIYLNELYYGNLAYGADAAASTYFDKDVSELTLAEAALLAGLPQLPAYYDPYSHPDRAKGRQAVVLSLMVEAGYITSAEADTAWLEPLSYAPLAFDLKAPHFTLFVRQQLESLLGPEALYQTGLNVTTTLDPLLQEGAQRIVHDQVAGLASHNVSNGALVSLRPSTGEILALVGSADFDNVEIDGQVNMALAPRQPGSSIKPLVYLAAFERSDVPPAERWSPGTLIADIEEPFPDGVNPAYVPTNYDNREHGMVTARAALANSYNIPAVRALQAVGISYFLETARRLGITTFTRPDYGLSLSLGSGEVPLLELTGAYAVLANQGTRLPPVSILRIADRQGSIICEFGTDRPCQPGSGVGQQVINPEDAFLLSDILSDNQARTPSFGANSVLKLDRPAAAKTGTTNDFRDNLTVGYTPELVTGVWVGNSDNSAMRNISGITGAGPIWHEFMTFALADMPAGAFSTPPGVRRYEICADTGTQPSQACPQRRQGWFAENRSPLPPEMDLYQIVRLDRVSGRLANEYTPSEAVEEKVFKIYPQPYRQWAEEHGIPQPPLTESDVFTFAPELFIRQPVEGEVVSGIVGVYGSANEPAFASYEIQYGISHDPGAFSPPISGPHSQPVIDGFLGEWDTSALSDGPHTLQLIVRDNFGHTNSKRVRLFVEQPTPTPLPTATPTAEPATPTSSPTVEPTVSPTVSPTVPPTALPTALPTAEPSVVPAETPTAISLPGDSPLSTPQPTATLIPAATALPATEVPAETPTQTPTPPDEAAAETSEPTFEPTPTWTPVGGIKTNGLAAAQRNPQISSANST